MIRHVVTFRFKPDTSDSDKQRLEESLGRFAKSIDVIRRYAFGRDLGLVDGNFDFAVVADFDTAADFQTYAKHELHLKLIREEIAPLLEERVAVQYEF